VRLKRWLVKRFRFLAGAAGRRIFLPNSRAFAERGSCRKALDRHFEDLRYQRCGRWFVSDGKATIANRDLWIRDVPTTLLTRSKRLASIWTPAFRRRSYLDSAQPLLIQAPSVMGGAHVSGNPRSRARPTSKFVPAVGCRSITEAHGKLQPAKLGLDDRRHGAT